MGYPYRLAAPYRAPTQPCYVAVVGPDVDDLVVMMTPEPMPYKEGLEFLKHMFGAHNDCLHGYIYTRPLTEESILEAIGRIDTSGVVVDLPDPIVAWVGRQMT
jgi:hypothetical protein